MISPWEDLEAEVNLDERKVTRHRAVVEIGALAYELEQLRHERGLAVDQIAAELDIEPSLVTTLESEGAAEAPFAMFMLYARHLGVEVQLFVDEE